MNIMKKSEINFTVELDENNLPNNIEWKASDANEGGSTKSVMMSLWDVKEKNTMRIDLWTKDMLVDEMKMFYHQSMLSMADSFERATGEAEMAKEMREFAQHFGEKLQLIKRAGS